MTGRFTPTIERACSHCGRVFVVPVRTTKIRPALYCSNDCKWSARRTTTERTCAHCGAVFRPLPANAKRGMGRFCSQACFWTSRRTPERKRRTAAYREWRDSVFARDNFTCQECGLRGGVLHAHHTLSWASHPEARFDTGNGVTLCEPCHQKHHPWMALVQDRH